jgi:hypothetical protein
MMCDVPSMAVFCRESIIIIIIIIVIIVIIIIIIFVIIVIVALWSVKSKVLIFMI